eukprot:m.14044 g.14044  ORF g.14044 m.14044 type:complete len:58 (-) comp4972_c0_seq2:759-932(-)
MANTTMITPKENAHINPKRLNGAKNPTLFKVESPSKGTKIMATHSKEPVYNGSIKLN